MNAHVYRMVFFFRVAVLAIIFGWSGATASAVQPISGISPERAATLPGIAELFRISNASETPVIVEGEPYVSNELVVRFLLELSDEDVADIAATAGASSAIRKSPLGLFVLKLPTQIKADMEEVMDNLWESNMTVSISPNYTGALPLYVPNDPIYPDQWHLDAVSGIDLDLPEAWNINRGSSSVVVAVIDSGLRMAHPEFSGRIFINTGEIPGNNVDDDGNSYVDDVSGWDTMGYDPPYIGDNDPSDPINGTGLGHGTWVASVLLANANNSHQVAGIDHFAKVLPIRCFDNSQFQYAEVAAAMDYIVDNPQFAQIVNMSFGRLTPLNSDTVTALNGMATSAILFTGSGNRYVQDGPGNADLYNPAAHPGVITVAGTDDADARAVFSDTGNSVQFAAPAVGIVTASFLDPTNPNAYDVGDGTSFAVPMVAGIAALGLSLRPEMTKGELVYALKQSALDLGSPGRDQQFGWGRVNAHGALLVLDSMLFWDGFETGDISRWH